MFCESLFFGKSEKHKVDVWIGTTLVRIIMMLIVRVDPPRIAKPEQEIGVHQTDEVVFPARPGDLLMTCVMHNKTNLRGNESQVTGNQGIEPTGVKRCYQKYTDSQETQIRENLTRIVGGLLVEQSTVYQQTPEFIIRGRAFALSGPTVKDGG